MYTTINFKTKKALTQALDAGERITVFQPGPFPGTTDGTVALEGPHFPKPHRWYARAVIQNSIIVRLLK